MASASSARRLRGQIPAPDFRLMATISIFLFLLLPLGNPQSTITQSDIAPIKAYADAFNQSRNYLSSSGPAEQYCLTSGTFLAFHPCTNILTCTETANLVCTVSGQGGCALDVLATAILDYKNGVDKLNAAYSSFISGYASFSASNIAGALDRMDGSFDAMKEAADKVSQSKLRLPDKIACPCTNSTDCCIGRCPEARFNYTAISTGKSEIGKVRLKSCTDGTPGGQCSSQKPNECLLGTLKGNSARCGCPSLMRAASDGKSCEYIPCMDNGVSVQEATCSPKTIGMKCEHGLLVSKPSECGCPVGQFLSGNICACPIVNSQSCNTTKITKYHNVTYLFDRGMKKTLNESYTFEKKICYAVQSAYTGPNCAQLINSSTNSTPIFESSVPQPPRSTVKAACSRCPAVCTREPPTGIRCGDCICPPNLGFCNAPDERMNVTGSSSPAYCSDELLQPQKEENAACSGGFECRTNECKNKICYDRQHDMVQVFLDWFGSLFGVWE